MKTTPILLLTGLLCLIGTSHAQTEELITPPEDIFVLETEQYKGYGHFGYGLTIFKEQPDSVESSWDACFPKIGGLPDTLDRMIKGWIMTDANQTIFQSYKAGLADTALFEQMFETMEMDTNRLSPTFVHAFVALAAGYDSQGKLRVVVDQNHNSDLTDDSLRYVMKLPKNHREQKDSVETALIPFSYETYDEGKLDTVDSWILLADANVASSPFEAYVKRAKHELLLMYNFGTYVRVPFTYKEKSYMLGMHESISGYRNGSVSVLEKTAKGWEPSYSVKRGQFLTLGGAYFLVDRIRPDGRAITLIRDPKATEKEMPQERMKAPSFTAQTINGESISLSDYQGKYILLDFWGSWCMPCIEELPALKRAYEIFHGEQFEVIGIALDDSANLKEFLAKNPIAWNQILQKMGPGGAEIVKKYDVSAYPTTFLIGPNGKILHKNLIGEKILARLCQLIPLTDGMKAQLLAGRTRFTLEGYGEEEAVTLALLRNEEKEKHPMYHIDGKWQLALDLEAGEYSYHFVLEDEEKIVDPHNEAQNEIGGEQYSFIVVP